MRNIHILPANKVTNLFRRDNGTFERLLSAEYRGKGDYQNIYITNDENDRINTWFKTEYGIYKSSKIPQKYVLFFKRRIILTTDQDLIKDGVQAIPDEFLEWFVKNPSYEEVEIEDVYKTFLEGNKRSVSNFRNRYKIIIPKEEPKQETLEEAIFRIKSENEHYIDEVAFELGAKWQQEQHKITIDDAYNEGFENGKHFEQERMYSEEDMIQFAQIYLSKRNDNPRMSNKDIFNLWFKQFKKK